MILDITDILTLLKKEYSHLGNILSLTPLQFSFHVNNQLFLVETEKDKYILKFNEALNDFYGIENASLKLETIGRCTKVLKENGLPVEETVASIEGNYVSRLYGGSIRLFRFIEGREYSIEGDADLRKLISFSKKLHTFPIRKLEIEIPNVGLHLSAPYPLEKTIDNFEFIQKKLKEEVGESWHVVSENFRNVLVEAENLIQWNQDKNHHLAHVDLHPRNVIVGFESGLSVIDLDYLRIGNPFVCLGLTFTRTTFFGKKERRGEDLEDKLSFFESVYESGPDSEFVKNLLYGALYIETEKIFRNLYRYYKTGMYRNFAEDVSKFHFQIFEIVRSIIKKRGY
ncbi:hypothetical protein A0128_07335 [Leptospira tipperaryensis]|uniref:Aminoglycoside phosphotransferase domain-containing protein n=1 Tax=Leptospira tipperaryensis TaxID=2564040 RepID=A0A1D7UVP1_9LEPT|nr:aminoglycoside phosphotransferase family protein [Leptospira tipperaryensis]AOP33669.1 hypothetical protein A0128_07335 [Leptospira tipperaryensis]